MTDKTIPLAAGHKRVIQRGPKPASGWISDGSTTLQATDSVTIPALGVVEPPPDPDPEPEPEPEPPPTGALRGFGKTVVRSTGNLTMVNNLAGLRTAAQAGGRNVKVDVSAGTVWSLSGANLTVRSGTSIDFGNLTLMDGSVFLAGVSDVYLENLRTHAGDQFGSAGELDSLTINGNQAPVRRVYVRNSQMLWGPDTCTAILGDIADVTFERCVFAEGLFNSKHPESPHSLGPNVASEDPSTPATGISFIECLCSTNQSRNFRLIGGVRLELIGCTIYNHNEGPQGCPTSANLLGCTWKKGPNALANNFLFRAQDGGHGAFTAKANTVFAGLPNVIGFTDSGVDAKVRSATPVFTSTEVVTDSRLAHSIVLASAGANPPDKQLSRIRQNVQSGTGTYVNGFGKPGSYTSLL
jgi:hypothetical protein